MTIAIKVNEKQFVKITNDDEILRELIDAGNCREFQGKQMFWVESKTVHSENIDDETAKEVISFFEEA